MNDVFICCKECGNKTQHCMCEKPQISDSSQAACSICFNDVEEWIKELEALDVTGESFADGFHSGTEMCVEILKERFNEKKQNA